MRGIVVAVNARRGMIIVKTQENTYSVLELIVGYDIEPGDILKGDLEDLAGQTIYNVTQDEEMDVYIQDIQASLWHAKQLIG